MEWSIPRGKKVEKPATPHPSCCFDIPNYDKDVTYLVTPLKEIDYTCHNHSMCTCNPPEPVRIKMGDLIDSLNTKKRKRDSHVMFV